MRGWPRFAPPAQSRAGGGDGGHGQNQGDARAYVHYCWMARDGRWETSLFMRQSVALNASPFLQPSARPAVRNEAGIGVASVKFANINPLL